MKKFFFLASLFAFVALTAVSCGKFEEGPSFSLASKKGRITGKWKASKVTSTTAGVSVDVTSSYEGFTVTYVKDGTGSTAFPFLGATITENFTWEFDDDDVTLLTTTDDGNGTLTTSKTTILRLTSKELIGQDVDGSTTNRFEMVPAE